MTPQTIPELSANGVFPALTFSVKGRSKREHSGVGSGVVGRSRGGGEGESEGGVVMVYISNGQVLDNRSRAPWSLSSITDFFWGIADFIVMFFQSIIHPDLRRGYTSSSSTRYDDGRGPPGFPRRRMGRITHFGGPSPPPMAGGG